MPPKCSVCGAYKCCIPHGRVLVRVESTDETSVLRAPTGSALDRYLISSDAKMIQVHHPDGEVVTFSLEKIP